MRKFKKNAKALSPVVASIILIAVTVAVSVVVAAWMGGMTTGLMGNAEQASITNVVFIDSTSMNVTVRNPGSAAVTLVSATIDGNSVLLLDAAGETATDLSIPKGESVNFVLELGGSSTFASGAQYNIKLLTTKGNSILYTATSDL
jgi:flagellin-like protein